MKKVISAFTLLAIIAILASSCKTHEKCPAYGQADKTVQHRG